jgi:hypothetical protein
MASPSICSPKITSNLLANTRPFSLKGCNFEGVQGRGHKTAEKQPTEVAPTAILADAMHLLAETGPSPGSRDSVSCGTTEIPDGILHGSSSGRLGQRVRGRMGQRARYRC